jgi:GntR family transcriptional regulator, transcriptional repressor for pyruvate dehydrogenase complex
VDEPLTHRAISVQATPPPEPLVRRSLVDLLTNKLREEILSGRYRQGATLPPERELADTLRVNRTSLKHALLRLEQLGLIAIRHGIGSVVLDPAETAGAELIAHLVFRADGVDPSMFADMIEARTLLGSFLARLAAERRSQADLKSLADLIAEVELAAGPADVQRSELEFFRAVVRATGNKVFAFLANSMFSIYRSQAGVFRAAFADRGFVQSSLERIRDAITAKDGAGAEAAASEYLRENGRRLVGAGLEHAEKRGTIPPKRRRGHKLAR